MQTMLRETKQKVGEALPQKKERKGKRGGAKKKRSRDTDDKGAISQ